MVKLSRVLSLTLVIIVLAACGRTNIDAPTATSVLFNPTDTPTPEPNADLQATAIARAAEQGEVLFNQYIDAAGFACITCHNVDSEETLVGPGMLGLGERAANSVEGLSAEEYLHQSIVEPNVHIVEGFPMDVMPKVYGDAFSDEELDALVTYLLGL